jgi:endonuclease G, mitochondrial
MPSRSNKPRSHKSRSAKSHADQPRSTRRSRSGFKARWQSWLLLGLGGLVLLGTLWMLLRPASDPTPQAAQNSAQNSAQSSSRPATQQQSVHLLMGNPSQAATDPNNFLIMRPQYAVSYNNSKRISNWSSWQLNRTWLGTSPRQNDFRPDDFLPPSWVHATPGDYSDSGYDRGHMTPSGDRSSTPENQSATFLMTNILPQAPDNNQGPWEKLEEYCRELVKQGKELYIVSGGYGNKGMLQKGKITIPEQMWKVIVVMNRPGLTPVDVTSTTRVIAVDMPNRQGIRETDWRTFRTSMAAIEAKTGYTLLSNVPTEVRQTLAKRVDKVQ